MCRIFLWCYLLLCVDKNNVNHKCLLQRSGYGDLWDDIQNVPETGGGDGVCSLGASSEETGGSNQSSDIERKEDSFCWKSEEEENWIKEDSLDAEDMKEEEGRHRGLQL